MSRFVDLILQEAEFWISRRAAEMLRPRTIFFGGGTPSLLPLENMARLLAGLRERLDLSAVEEWTIEVNPATASFDYCRMLREFGIDRLSFGAQSFDLRELATLERHHNPDDVPRSIELARRSGFSRLNLDLIYAIPRQDLSSWSQSLERAIALDTPHLSCYGLTYEPNTPMAVKKRLGMVRGVEESVELEMLHHTRRRLRAIGIPPYEISNYARDGEACRHNLVYWTGGNYLGLGPSAASHIEGWRWRNRGHLGEWENAITASTLPVIDVEHLADRQRAGELAMLMLRLTHGIDLRDFIRRTGQSALEMFADPIDRFSRSGHLQSNSCSVFLTEKGVDLADAIAADFLVP